MFHSVQTREHSVLKPPLGGEASLFLGTKSIGPGHLRQKQAEKALRRTKIKDRRGFLIGLLDGQAQRQGCPCAIEPAAGIRQFPNGRTLTGGSCNGNLFLPG